MRCPNCGSSNVQFVATNKTTAPSITSGICGYFILGPLGLLCALCGVSNKHEEYWVCNDCARKFKESESLEVKEKKIEDNIKRCSYSVSNMEKRIAELENKKNDFAEQNILNQENLDAEIGDTYKSSKSILDKKNKQYKENEKIVLKDNKKFIALKYLKWFWALVAIIVYALNFSNEKINIVSVVFLICFLLWLVSDFLYKKLLFKIDNSAVETMSQLKKEKKYISYCVEQYKLKDDIEKENKKIEKLYQSKKSL